MPKKFDSCVRKVKRKIKSGAIPKTFKCDVKGRPNKRGKKKCKTNAYAICKRKRKLSDEEYEKYTGFSRPNWGE